MYSYFLKILLLFGIAQNFQYSLRTWYLQFDI